MKVNTVEANGFDVKNRINSRRSEEMQEIIGHVPSWIIRRGTLLILIIFILMSILAWIGRIPDVVNIRVIISDVAPPIKIIAASNGKLQALLVKDKEDVHKGQILGIIENPARFEDIFLIAHELQILDTALDMQWALEHCKFPSRAQAGELQDAYVAFLQTLESFEFFNQTKFQNKKIEQIESQMNDQRNLYKSLQEKDSLLKEQINSENFKIAANKKLLDDKIIAPVEYEEIKKHYNDQQIVSVSNQASMIENKLREKDYSKDITVLKQDKRRQENEYITNIRDAGKKLMAQIKLWEQKYAFISPEEGRISLFGIWTVNQFIRAGDPVLVISPPKHDYTVKGVLPAQGAGKVLLGQKVLIRLDAYPYQEFGQIRGTVSSVSDVMLDSSYSVTINLSQGLVSGSGRKIPDQPELQGEGQILTNSKNIYQRIFENTIGKFRH